MVALWCIQMSTATRSVSQCRVQVLDDAAERGQCVDQVVQFASAHTEPCPHKWWVNRDAVAIGGT